MSLAFSNAFSNFHSHYLISNDPHYYVLAQYLAWNMCPMTLVLFFPLLTLLHGF